MKTFLLIIGFTILAKIATPFVMAIISLPGRLIAFPHGANKHSRGRVVIGYVVSITVQVYIYLAYTAIIVSWATGKLTADNQLIVWPLAFFIAVIPLLVALRDARKSAKEVAAASQDMTMKMKVAIGQPDAAFKMLSQTLLITFLTTVLAFSIFALMPEATHLLYPYLPLT